MASVAVEFTGNPSIDPKISLAVVTEENEIRTRTKACESDLQSFSEDFSAKCVLNQTRVTDTEILDKGYLTYGCSHYRRRCRIRAPCCNEIFSCRHCHNEAKNSICIDQKLRHDMPRHLVEKVICSLCDTEQELFSGSTSLQELWCMHGEILLWNLQAV